MNTAPKIFLLDRGLQWLLMLAFAFAAALYLKNGWAHLMAAQKNNMHDVVGAFGIIAIGLYTLIISFLFAVRHKPVRSAAGWRPQAAALLGGFLLLGLVGLKPRDDLPLSLMFLADSLLLIGNLAAVYVLLWLGRSFSILPQSRRLVTVGPYRYVRHPLYVAEAVAALGALINFFSPLAVLLIVTQLALQIVRMHYEEQVLRDTFPDYADYARHTARLIPGCF